MYMYIIYLDICAMVKVKTWVAFPPKKMIIWSVDLPGGTSVRRCLGGAKYVFFYVIPVVLRCYMII